MADYLNVVYNTKDRPVTEYPQQLTRYLSARYQMRPGQRLLEAGCGRGDFLRGFAALGIECSGCDLSAESQKFLPEFEIKQANIEENGLPYADNTFDFIYSKSVLEHFFHPDKYLREALRVLKPGGTILTLVPDWEANYKIYFDDYTHRTPFTKVALEDIYKICGFETPEVVKFRQLPVVWKYPALNMLCAVLAPFVPIRSNIKFLRWSRELMLIGCARKPMVK